MDLVHVMVPSQEVPIISYHFAGQILFLWMMQKHVIYMLFIAHCAQALWLLSFLLALAVSVFKALTRPPLTPFPFLYL
jgi:hypothetical protein